MISLIKFSFKFTLVYTALLYISSALIFSLGFNYTSTYTSTNLNLRSDSTFKENVITTIPVNSKIKIVKQSTDWTLIIYRLPFTVELQKGYVATKFLKEKNISTSSLAIHLWIILHSISIFYLIAIRKLTFNNITEVLSTRILSPFTLFQFPKAIIIKIYTTVFKKKEKTITYYG
jgi:uncharacterized protein YgiM (DUF1202 family)